MRWTHLAVVFIATIQGLRIEYEDLVGEEQSDFDIGVLMSKWLGAPNTETFDWWDVVAISLGGLTVLFLQWQSTRRIRLWRRFPLFLKEQVAPLLASRSIIVTPRTPDIIIGGSSFGWGWYSILYIFTQRADDRLCILQ